MQRLMPKSLMGQVLLAVALALLAAQTLSAILLYQAADTRRNQAAVNAAAFRIVSYTTRLAREAQLEVEDRARNRELRRRNRAENMADRIEGRERRMPRTLRIEQSKNSPLLEGERALPELSYELANTLEREGQAVSEVVVLHRALRDDPFIRARPHLLARAAQDDAKNATLLVAGVRLHGQEGWLVARAVKPPTPRGGMATIILQTVLIFLVLMVLHFLLLRRITRPLADLTHRTESFGAGPPALQQGHFEPMEARGPDDVRRLISAHNAMEARIAGLLDEKDVMLGAIGHDLKTPLAALRVRIESVEDDRERARMAASIEDITRSLDDILSLARVGRSDNPPEKTELSALVASIVEEFEDMDKPVTLAGTGRVTAYVHVTWLRRALRNLIENALRYAGSAQVSLHIDQDHAILRVEDRGPGIAEDALATIAEPFKRGEQSRNRQTGGAGLGLTLARAIAQQHDGELILTNRQGGGLRADIRIPAAQTR